jgi:TPR repeat protein
MADKGHEDALYNLGMRYHKGSGTKQDHTKAFEW